MLNRLMVAVIIALILPSRLNAQAETLKFAWPDGASAKVRVRSEGKRESSRQTITWDMSTDFTMQLKRTNNRIVVSRNNFSGWKGILPPSFGGGAERFVDMVPTLNVTDAGVFVGIEGHETARKLMSDSVAQSGGLDPIARKAFEAVSSDTSLNVMAQSQWTTMAQMWRGFELDPEVSYEINSVTPVPHLGGGEVAIVGKAGFVKETPCESTRTNQRCVHLLAESEADKEQVRKLLQSFFRQAGPNAPIITAFDQQYKVALVVEKTTMLPHHLKITRIHNLMIKERMPARDQSMSEVYSATYTFTWL